MYPFWGELLPMVVVFGLAALVASVLPLPVSGSDSTRVEPIDGLRGYLALSVFVFHIFLWEKYLRVGTWGKLDFHFQNHLGQSSVALFFMITGFLFWRKACLGAPPVDWARLYISRFLRIYPLFFISVLGVMILWFSHNGLALRVPKFQFVKESANLLLLTAFSPEPPSFNGDRMVGLLYAGVYWTLPYEAFFYAALPAFAFLSHRLVPARYVIVGCASLLGLFLWGPQQAYLWCFAVGAIVALLVRRPELSHRLARPHFSFLFFGLLGLLVAVFPGAKSPGAIITLGFMFLIVASGNTLLGLLLLRPSLTLGRISYGIYLLHGLILWIGVHYFSVIVKDEHPLLTRNWAFLCTLTLLLVVVSWITYRCVELPCLGRVGQYTRTIRAACASTRTWRRRIFSGPRLNDSPRKPPVAPS
ncbi:acyltransferase [Luteimonas sp. XNQY3]|nr:acyltransferase [Luteimonas sp. XNQY3]MCD9008192.1 acyltransferase [Luteimonas sp. XNQY3]